MKVSSLFALIASVSAISLSSLDNDGHHVKPAGVDCPPELEISEKNLNREMDLFSRNFDEKHY